MRLRSVMSRKQFTAPTTSPFALRSGSMLIDTIMREPSLRSTMRSASRTGVPVASTSASIERAIGVPSSSKKRESSVNCSCVWPGPGARPQISTARRLYCRMVPRGVADEGRDRQHVENAVGRPQHRAQRRGNRPSARPAVVVRIKHPHASARRPSIPLYPGATIRPDGDLSMVSDCRLRVRTVQGRLRSADWPACGRSNDR